MAVMIFVRDLAAFPVAWISGESYQEVRTKALNFIRTAIRVGVACGLIYEIYKGQYHYELQRRVVIPVAPRLEMTLAGLPVTLAPVTLLINGALIAVASSNLRIGVYGTWALLQIFNPKNFQQARPMFSAAIIKETLRLDAYTILVNLALNILPEVQLGPGIYWSSFGIFQLAAFTFDRLNNAMDTPTELALKGIVHLMMGFECIGMYEKYNRQLEVTDNKKNTFIYKVADKLSPLLAWVATGR
jgi:hypothetical protein